jgi:hypothetical protein
MYFNVSLDTRGHTPDLDVDTCLLCGFLMNKYAERRNKQISGLVAVLKQRCIETDHVFKNLMQMYTEAVQRHRKTNSRVNIRVPLCIACENWRRRLVCNKGRCVKILQPTNKMIPMDTFVLFIHEPGIFKEPDRRALSRLLKCLSSQYRYVGFDKDGREQDFLITNPYMMQASHVMTAVVDMFKDTYYRDHTRLTTDSSPFPSQPPCCTEMFYKIISVWWQCNCCTPILGNRINAKYIRRVCRDLSRCANQSPMSYVWIFIPFRKKIHFCAKSVRCYITVLYKRTNGFANRLD